MIIEFDKDACIGCGSCNAVCPDNWVMDESGSEVKAKPIKTKLSEVGCNSDAADTCPVDAIKVIG
ncbi:MAG: ferredoxin [DPANN group archaeon]|nr:ferredoxin [DPANN group archaeon]